MLVESRGPGRNTNYVAGLEALIRGLADVDASIDDIVIDSAEARELPIDQRRPKLRSQLPWSQLLQPALAGLLVGGIGYFGLTQVMGAGYQAIDQAMHSQFTWRMLLVLALFKNGIITKFS